METFDGARGEPCSCCSLALQRSCNPTACHPDCWSSPPIAVSCCTRGVRQECMAGCPSRRARPAVPTRRQDMPAPVQRAGPGCCASGLPAAEMHVTSLTRCELRTAHSGWFPTRRGLTPPPPVHATFHALPRLSLHRHSPARATMRLAAFLASGALLQRGLPDYKWGRDQVWAADTMATQGNGTRIR